MSVHTIVRGFPSELVRVEPSDLTKPQTHPIRGGRWVHAGTKTSTLPSETCAIAANTSVVPRWAAFDSVAATPTSDICDASPSSSLTLGPLLAPRGPIMTFIDAAKAIVAPMVLHNGTGVRLGTPAGVGR